MTTRLRDQILSCALGYAALTTVSAGPAFGQDPPGAIQIRLVEVDVRAAVQALAPHIDRPVVFGAIGDGRVTIETPGEVASATVLDLLREALRTQRLELIDTGASYRIEPIEPPPPEPRTPATTQEASGPLRLFVIRLKHARAEDVSATVSALYGRPGALGELGAPVGSTLSAELEANLVPPRAGVRAGPIVGAVADLEGDVTIVPDPGTNSLLVRASQADFDLVSAAVEELDVRPLQVLIEVVIAEVRRDRNLGFGLETILPPYEIDAERGTTIEGSVEGLGLGDFVLRVMKLGGIDLSGTLRAAASRGDVTILSRPVLIAANNEPAQLLVGSQRPFVQVQRSLPTDAPQRDQVVQFKEVGTKLSVVPTISDNGYVMMEVVQEVNAATAEVAFDAPVISTRTVETRLLVRDGHTAVLGGLADRQISITQAGVPVLSAIPLIGGLFGRRVETESETELFLFLTPRIVRTDDDLDSLTRKLPAGSRHVGKEIRKSGWFKAYPSAEDSAPALEPKTRSRRGGRGR